MDSIGFFYVIPVVAILESIAVIDPNIVELGSHCVLFVASYPISAGN